MIRRPRRRSAPRSSPTRTSRARRRTLDARGQPAPPARALAGQPTGLSCASCHDLGRAGVDLTSTPGNISAGAGWTDVNALSVVNSVYNRLWFRNGRADSSWAVAAGVAESPTTMNGNRLHTAWVIADNYREAYDAVFKPAGYPLPPPGRSTDIPTSTRFPLDGKPGQPAWDSMAPADQDAVTRVLVNWAKAIDAYEATLIVVLGPRLPPRAGAGAVAPTVPRP